MIRLVLVLVMYLISQVMTSQTKFEQGMQHAIQLMHENKLEEASNFFERIGNAEPNNWLPYYNLALLKTRTTFDMQDKTKVEAQLAVATDFADKVGAISPDNAEIYVLKALINVAKIASNPMVYGPSLSAETTALYQKATELDNSNPRAQSGLVEFEMGSARFFNQDLSPYCSKLQATIALYDNFKPATKLHPQWGKSRVMALLKDCGKLKEAKKEAVTIKVTVPNVTSDKGSVHYALYDRETFMKTPLDGKIAEIKKGVSTVIFDHVKAGVYAIICYHDLNENNKMDFDEQMMPLEDYGMTNNAAVMGPPTFEAAKFTVENKSLDLTIKF